mmetsp:Transcript_1865/g.4785  ORF Transcript_1865/g.4785 Transcript_1865/m.4785 type:complete len:225 (-) Transcript_1865:37-711(-)
MVGGAGRPAEARPGLEGDHGALRPLGGRGQAGLAVPPVRHARQPRARPVPHPDGVRDGRALRDRHCKSARGARVRVPGDLLRRGRLEAGGRLLGPRRQAEGHGVRHVAPELRALQHAGLRGQRQRRADVPLQGCTHGDGVQRPVGVGQGHDRRCAPAAAGAAAGHRLRDEAREHRALLRARGGRRHLRGAWTLLACCVRARRRAALVHSGPGLRELFTARVGQG